jgi:SNF2 family DNA or RNA helicase
MPFADVDMSVNPPMISVATEWNEKELIQQIPGARYQKRWRVPLTWAACLQLRAVFGGRLIIGKNLFTWATEYRGSVINPSMELRELTEPVIPVSNDKLFPFQRACVDFMRVAKRGIIGDEMGCGKTIEVIGYLETLELDDFPILIICPNSVKHHWSKHIQEWLPSISAYVLEGTAVVRRKIIENAKKESEHFPTIVITNLESMRTLSRLAPYGSVRLKKCKECDRFSSDEDVTARTCQVHQKPLNDVGFKVIIVDEIHRIKAPKSQQTRAVWAICHEPSVNHVWGLTGTPIANNVGDLWSAMHAIDLKQYPTRSKFVDRYALTSWNNFGGLDVVGLDPNTSAEFQQIFKPNFRRMLKVDVLPQLPKEVHTVREVDLSRSQRALYDSLSESIMARMDDGQLMISPAQLGTATRLSQISCASIVITDKPNPDDPSTWKIDLKEPSSKIDELVEVIRELGTRKAVVTADHSKLIDLASIRLTKEGIHNLKITGDVSPYDRTRALNALNDGQIQVLLFTTKAGGVGLDMSEASCLVWLQHPWSMVDYLQAVNRINRVGSERHNQLDIVHIIARDTMEATKIERLQEKLRRLEEITQDRNRLAARKIDTTTLDDEAARISSAFIGMV